jgi:predicted DNA-binding transcriptional regulator AlpA
MTNDNLAPNPGEDPLLDLLSDQQIAAQFPISLATIARQRKLGAFPPPVKIGRLTRTWRSDVKDYFRPSSRRAEG